MKIIIESDNFVDILQQFGPYCKPSSSPPDWSKYPYKLTPGDIIHDSRGKEFIVFPEEGWKHESIKF